MSVLNTEALFRSNLEKTNKKSMVLVATKKEEANDVPGGLLHVHTVSSGLESADTCSLTKKVSKYSNHLRYYIKNGKWI